MLGLSNINMDHIHLCMKEIRAHFSYSLGASAISGLLISSPDPILRPTVTITLVSMSVTTSAGSMTKQNSTTFPFPPALLLHSFPHHPPDYLITVITHCQFREQGSSQLREPPGVISAHRHTYTPRLPFMRSPKRIADVAEPTTPTYLPARACIYH